MKPTIIAIDLAKNSSWVCVYNPNSGKVIRSRSVSRRKLFEFVAQQPRGLVAMEACTTAHYWARRFKDELKHKVRLVAPHHVAKLRHNAKNDRNDALAIAETVVRPKMRFVAVKSVAQLDLQALHRHREMLLRDRIAHSNQIRAFLAENGICVSKSIAAFRREVPAALDDESNALSGRMRALLRQVHERFVLLDEAHEEATKELKKLARQHERCKDLMALPGIGEMNATALWASIGNGSQFKKGRQAAANLGIVPRQFSTGGKTILGKITKQGNSYLRKLLIEGSQSVINNLRDKQDSHSCWVRQLVRRVGREKAAVALANKNARIAWAILRYQKPYDPERACAAVPA